MGHVRLGRLPASRMWNDVVAGLALGAGADVVAADAATAAEGALQGAAGDAGLAQAVLLLAELPVAARSGLAVWTRYLEEHLQAQSGSSILELAGSAVGAVAAAGRSSGYRTDLGEMAALSLAESITAVVGRGLPGLFTPGAVELQREFARYATRDGFAELARDFFARLTRRQLDYYLARTLADHIGPGRRFESSEARARFDRELDQHCREASRIIKEYAGAWLSKSQYERSLSLATARAFAAHASRKIAAELRRRRVAVA